MSHFNLENLKMIAAVSSNGVIGVNGGLPFHCPEDLRYFKEKTLHNIVIMGSKTFKSLPNGNLPSRVNIVMSKQDPLPSCFNVTLAVQSIKQLNTLLNHCLTPYNTPWIIGGRQMYSLFMPYTKELHLNVINEQYAIESAEDVTMFPFEDLDKYMTLYSTTEYEHKKFKTLIYRKNDRPNL